MNETCPFLVMQFWISENIDNHPSLEKYSWYVLIKLLNNILSCQMWKYKFTLKCFISKFEQENAQLSYKQHESALKSKHF